LNIFGGIQPEVGRNSQIF